MRLPVFIQNLLKNYAIKKLYSDADFVIGDRYLERHFIIPRNRFFNIYLHRINKSDDDRALHDHPWINISLIIDGSYIEHRIAAGGCEYAVQRNSGDIVFRRAITAHRLEVRNNQSAISLFITGPKIHNWGFHCPKAGWVRWQDFVSSDDHGNVGKGCGE